MSIVRIKHNHRKQGYLPLGKCSHPNCDRDGEEIEGGKLVCGRHLTLTLTTAQSQNLRAGQRIGR